LQRLKMCSSEQQPYVDLQIQPLTLNMFKKWMVGALSTIFSMHKMSSIFGTISNSKKSEKQTSLDLSFNITVLQTMSSLFSFFFWFTPIEFPSKMMSCKWTSN
jgi:hypothetical protein